MSKLTCDMCMDLIPLVQDGVASEDSAAAEQEHIASCPRCRALYNERPPAETIDPKVNAKIKARLQSFFAVLVLMGVFFGVSLQTQEGAFYPLLFLPLLGACSYIVFRWRALWKLPLLLGALLLAAHGVAVVQGAELNPLGILFWMAINTLLTDMGTLIAGLFHFAFRKENRT